MRLLNIKCYAIVTCYLNLKRIITDEIRSIDNSILELDNVRGQQFPFSAKFDTSVIQT